MKRYKIKITKQAKEHLKEIRRYYEKDIMRPDIAKQKIQAIRAGLATLSDMPERFATIEEKPWCDEGVRKMILSPYLAYYWIDEKQNKVQVIAVIHEKQDQIRQLQILASKADYEGPFTT